jgi:Family of unknown function (DUF6086)
MGVTISCNGRDVWAPSLKVGYLFFDQVQALEKVVGVKSGIDSFVADEFQIDDAVLGKFILKVLEMLENTNNGALFALSGGCIQICLALLAQISGEWPAVPKKLEPLLLGARSVLLPRDF